MRATPAMALIALVLVVTGAACGERPDAGGGAGPDHDPVAGDYVSDSVPGPPFGGDGAPRLRLTLGEGTIRFVADCNTFSGAATWQDGRFSAQGLGGTEMGCPDDAQQRDDWLLDFFSRADRIERDGTDLALHAGQTTIWFVPADEVGEGRGPAVPLEGTSWALTATAEYDGDTGSVGSIPAGVTATLRIEGGRVLFETGCNSGGGPAEVDDQKLLLGELAVTLRGCLDARADVEKAVLQVLDGSIAWEITGRELRLRKGAHELVYTASPDSSVADSAAQ